MCRPGLAAEQYNIRQTSHFGSSMETRFFHLMDTGDKNTPLWHPTGMFCFAYHFSQKDRKDALSGHMLYHLLCQMERDTGFTVRHWCGRWMKKKSVRVSNQSLDSLWQPPCESTGISFDLPQVALVWSSRWMCSKIWNQILKIIE